MAKTKKRSTKKTTKVNFDKQLLKDVLLFVFLTLAFYTVMFVALYSGGSRDCAFVEEIEQGCQTDTPFSLLLLLPSMLLAGVLQAGLKRMSEIKKRVKKLR